VIDPRDLIVLDGVTKVFDGLARPAIDDLSLVVEAGSFVTVVGPSGSGKSTLLRLLAGLLQPDRGRVTIFGEAPAQASQAKHLGWVPQSPALLPWRSVLDNVRLPFEVNRRAPVDGRDPKAVLEQLGLGQHLHRRPAELSGGMRQRVAIARAFAFGPRVLLMDEPFSALDELTREGVAHQLLDLWQAERRTVIFVTHSVVEATLLSDRVAVVGDGRLQAVVDIPLSRPRLPGIAESAEFHAVTAQIRAFLRAASPWPADATGPGSRHG
jgi:NitT/TauT family transport system ATP-binding protein